MPKAMFEHCTQVYNAMVERAEITDEGPVYTGFLTHLFKSLGLSVPYYSQVMTELVRMDCARQLKRGGGPAPSIWLMLQPPDKVLFDNLPEMTRRALGGSKVQLRVEQEIKNLEERVSKLEGKIA